MTTRTAIATNIAGSMVLAFLVLPILAVIPASFNHASARVVFPATSS